MSEEKGATAELVVPSTDTTHVDEVQKAIQDLPDVGVPEIASEEIVPPSDNQKKIRKLSEKQLKQRENARASKKQKSLTIANDVSLLKQKHDELKEQFLSSEKQWQDRLKTQQAEYEDRFRAHELKMAEHYNRLNQPTAVSSYQQPAQVTYSAVDPAKEMYARPFAAYSNPGYTQGNTTSAAIKTHVLF